MAKISESTSISLNRQTTAPATAPGHVGQPYVLDVAAAGGLERSLSLLVGTDTTAPTDFATVGFIPLGYTGDPNGSVLSRCDRDICFDISASPPNAYVALAGGGTVWELFGAAGGGGGGTTVSAAFDTFGTDANQSGSPGAGGFAIFKAFAGPNITGHTSGFRIVAALEDGVDYDSFADGSEVDISTYLEGTGTYAIAPFTLTTAGRSYSSGSGCVATNNGTPAGAVIDIDIASTTMTDNEESTVSIVRAVDIRRSGATGVVIGWA